MKPLKSAWQVFGRISLWVGSPLLAAGIVCGLLWLSSPANIALFAVTLAIGINGLVWFSLGAAFSLVARREKAKFERLQREGLRYEATIVRFGQSLRAMRFGSYSSACLECGYTNRQGETCLVKSGSLLLESPLQSSYAATVYVNQNDPYDYYVEVYMKTEENGGFTHDYR